MACDELNSGCATTPKITGSAWRRWGRNQRSSLWESMKTSTIVSAPACDSWKEGHSKREKLPAGFCANSPLLSDKFTPLQTGQRSFANQVIRLSPGKPHL